MQPYRIQPCFSRNEVLVVDASGPCLNPESSEVTITEHKVFSPAKVICHSPSPERQKRSFELDNITGKYDLKVESPVQIVFGTAGSTHNSKDWIFIFYCIIVFSYCYGLGYVLRAVAGY